VLANIQANTLSYPENFEGAVTLFYEKATIKIGGTAMNKIVYWKGAGEDRAAKFNEKPIGDIYGNGHLDVIKNVTGHLLEGKDLLIPGSEGLASLKVISAAYESLKTGRPVRI
jgi:UDP-N-acetyl-2-amino-2-deoxyglucuronate dehydrogenase